MRALFFRRLRSFWVSKGRQRTIVGPRNMSRSKTVERDGNMNKNELVAAVAEKAGLTKADAASAVDAAFETVQGELKNGGDIRLAGFGSFPVSRREAPTGRNPSTGAAVEIPARNVPKF